ncbi:MAG: hypothetical protein ACOCV2_01610 [Persicimonas sp.]
MGNRIDKNTSSTSNVSSSDASTVDNEPTSNTGDASRTEEAGDSSLFYTDQMVRGADQQSEFEQMTTGDKPGSSAEAPDEGEKTEAKTVMEMRAEQSASKKGVDFDDHEFANKLSREIFENENKELFGRPPEEIDSAFAYSPAVSGASSAEFLDNRELLEDREALEGFIAKKLASRDDAPDDPDEVERVASQLADNVEKQAVRGVADRIEMKVKTRIEDARERLATLNNGSESRRTFLAQIAAMSDDRKTIQSRLEEMGIAKGKAEEIGSILADVEKKDSDAIEALQTGEPGPEVGMFQKSGAYERAESLLGEELDAMDGKLERLHGDAANKLSQGKGALLFGDANLEAARAEAFDELDLSPDASTQEATDFDRAVAEALEEAEGAEGAESLTTSILGAASSVTDPPVVGTLIRGGVDMIVKQEELELARAAEHADLAADDAVDDAEVRRKVEVAKSAAALMLGSSGLSEKIGDNAPGIKGQPVAEEYQELVGGAGEAAIGETINQGVDKVTDAALDD